MQDWQLDFEWLKVRHQVQKLTGRDSLPDLNTMLFLIGVRELGKVDHSFSKEEKQDLMHIAACRLLSSRGFYEFEGIDQDGWPHWKIIKGLNITGVKDQSILLKELIIEYFKDESLFEEE